MLVTIGAIITALVQFVFWFNFFWSIWKGKQSGHNPWEATTLEWSTPETPPPHDNFAGIPPTVYRGAYEYSVPGAPNDFIMQVEPDPGFESSPLGHERASGNGQDGHKH